MTLVLVYEGSVLYEVIVKRIGFSRAFIILVTV